MFLVFQDFRLPETNRSSLKIDGWETAIRPSFWVFGFGLFSGAKWLLDSGRGSHLAQAKRGRGSSAGGDFFDVFFHKNDFLAAHVDVFFLGGGYKTTLSIYGKWLGGPPKKTKLPTYVQPRLSQKGVIFSRHFDQ